MRWRQLSGFVIAASKQRNWFGVVDETGEVVGIIEKIVDGRWRVSVDGNVIGDIGNPAVALELIKACRQGGNDGEPE
jgi:hypothetical protein